MKKGIPETPQKSAGSAVVTYEAQEVLTKKLYFDGTIEFLLNKLTTCDSRLTLFVAQCQTLFVKIKNNYEQCSDIRLEDSYNILAEFLYSLLDFLNLINILLTDRDSLIQETADGSIAVEEAIISGLLSLNLQLNLITEFPNLHVDTGKSKGLSKYLLPPIFSEIKNELLSLRQSIYDFINPELFPGLDLKSLSNLDFRPNDVRDFSRFKQILELILQILEFLNTDFNQTHPEKVLADQTTALLLRVWSAILALGNQIEYLETIEAQDIKEMKSLAKDMRIKPGGLYRWLKNYLTYSSHVLRSIYEIVWRIG